MRTFKEYYIDSNSVGAQTIYLPKGAEVVNARSGVGVVILDTIIDPNESLTSLRTFRSCSVGENIYNDTVKYINYVTTNFGAIRFIVEIV